MPARGMTRPWHGIMQSQAHERSKGVRMAEELGITPRLRVKPTMTPENLVEMLEGKGVTFNRTSRDEAIAYLKDVNHHSCR